MNVINQSNIDNSLTYSEYKKLILELFEKGKTTGSDQSAEMIDYTKMNIHRMNRLEKTVVLNDELIVVTKNVANKYYWVCLTEAWCGDAAQILPILDKISNLNPNIELRLLLRDENPDVINDNLTNGTKSIPKLIILDTEFNKLNTWGPRPDALSNFVNEYKAKPNFNKADMIKEIQIWYNKDNTQQIQNEMINLINGLA